MKNFLACVILIVAIFWGISHCSTGEFPEMLISTEDGESFPASNLIHRKEEVIIYYWNKDTPIKNLVKLNAFHKNKIRPKMATIFVGTKEEIRYAQENIIHVSTFSFNTLYATAKIEIPTPFLVITKGGVLKKIVKNPDLSKIIKEGL